MKRIYVFLLLITNIFIAKAQTLMEIPNLPNYTNLGKGYTGWGITFLNDVYLKYDRNDNRGTIVKYDGTTLTEIPLPPSFDTIYSNLVPQGIFGSHLYLAGIASYRNHSLFQYDGTTLTEIPSPPNFNGVQKGLHSPETAIIGNTLYLRYKGNDDNYDLFKYDGTTLTEIPSPPNFNGANKGLMGNFIVMRDTLYLLYLGNDNCTDLFKYDGTTLTEIPSPSGYDTNSSGYVSVSSNTTVKSSIIFNNALYMRYLRYDGIHSLFKYDGTTLTEIVAGYSGEPIIYNSNLYLQFKSGSEGILCKYDGTTLSYITNPTNFSGPNSGYIGAPIIFNSILYLRYMGNNLNSDLFKYDGTTLTEIPSPFSHSFPGSGYAALPIIMDSILCLRYIDGNGSFDLFKYNGTTLTHVPTPLSHWGLALGYSNSTAPIVFNNNLYMSYQGTDYNFDLFRYDGATLTEIPSPPNFDSTYAGYYTGSPIISGGHLYMQYWSNTHNYTLFKLDPCATTYSSINVTNCNNYTSPSNNHVWTTSGVYTDTIPGSCGADSIITVNLTINTSSSNTDTQVACNTFTWIDGNAYTSSNNTATHTITGGATNGCDSVVTLDLTINIVDTSVTDMGTSFMANATGASYQWVDCNNGNAPIAGETNQTFTPMANGDYAVEITANGCTSMSSCYNITGVSVQNLNANTIINLYPNPIENQVMVDFGTDMQDVTVRIFALDGRILQEHNAVNGKQFNVSLKDYPTAMYFLEVLSKDGQSTMLKVSKL